MPLKKKLKNGNMPLFTSKEIKTKTTDPGSSKAATFSIHGKACGAIINKKADLKAAFLAMEEDESVFYFTDGAWSNHDLIVHLLEQSGPAAVYLSTWSIGEESLRQLHHLISSGIIVQLHCLFDQRISQQKAKELQLAKGTANSVVFKKNHSKTVAIKGPEKSFVIYTSANLTHNPRMEAGVVHCGRSVADFTIEFLTREINGQTRAAE